MLRADRTGVSPPPTALELCINCAGVVQAIDEITITVDFDPRHAIHIFLISLEIFIRGSNVPPASGLSVGQGGEEEKNS